MSKALDEVRAMTYEVDSKSGAEQWWEAGAGGLRARIETAAKNGLWRLKVQGLLAQSQRYLRTLGFSIEAELPPGHKLSTPPSESSYIYRIRWDV